MNRGEFSNALRIMTSLDRHELEQADVLPIGDHNAWGTFRRDPFRWMIRADEATADRLFRLIMSRQPAHLSWVEVDTTIRGGKRIKGVIEPCDGTMPEDHG